MLFVLWNLFVELLYYFILIFFIKDDVVGCFFIIEKFWILWIFVRFCWRFFCFWLWFFLIVGLGFGLNGFFWYIIIVVIWVVFFLFMVFLLKLLLLDVICIKYFGEMFDGKIVLYFLYCVRIFVCKICVYIFYFVIWNIMFYVI